MRGWARRCSRLLLLSRRFTEVKRLGLAHRGVHASARGAAPAGRARAPRRLPGEWEGEHHETVQRTRARDVFQAGWHEHDALRDFFGASDAVAQASVREQFGSVLVEGMACGLPAVAVDRFGPADIVRPQTGWLMEPDDEASLAAALAQVISDPDERERRGAAARADVVERFAWPLSPSGCATCSRRSRDRGPPRSRRDN